MGSGQLSARSVILAGNVPHPLGDVDQLQKVMKMYHDDKDDYSKALQKNLSSIMKQVDKGAEILITRRNRVVAKLSPVSETGKMEGSVRCPDFSARLKRIARMITGSKGSMSDLIISERAERSLGRWG